MLCLGGQSRSRRDRSPCCWPDRQQRRVPPRPSHPAADPVRRRPRSPRELSPRRRAALPSAPPARATTQPDHRLAQVASHFRDRGPGVAAGGGDAGRRWSVGVVHVLAQAPQQPVDLRAPALDDERCDRPVSGESTDAGRSKRRTLFDAVHRDLPSVRSENARSPRRPVTPAIRARHSIGWCSTARRPEGRRRADARAGAIHPRGGRAKLSPATW